MTDGISSITTVANLLQEQEYIISSINHAHSSASSSIHQTALYDVSCRHVSDDVIDDVTDDVIDDVTTRNGPSVRQLATDSALYYWRRYSPGKGPEKVSCCMRASGRREWTKTRESGTGYPCRVIA